MLPFRKSFVIVISIISVVKSTWKEVDEIFDDIEKDHSKLRKLFESVIEEKTAPPPVPEKRDYSSNMVKECVCVPVYLCDDDGFIKTDGASLINFKPRISGEENVQKCDNPLEVCCKEPQEEPVIESTCGYSGSIMTNNIRKDPGTSLFGEFPWTAMILENANYVCVGSLIHPQVVLTAAHCVNATVNYTVRVGEWDVTNKKEPLPYQSQNMQTIVIHPQFNPSNLHYDAALLVLPKPFELKENVNVACIAEHAWYHLKNSYDKCAATGWGFDKVTELYKRVMKRVEFTLVQHKQCEERFRTASHLGKWFELHRSFICASGQNDYDVCTGDGGGPLVCPIPGAQNRYQLVGLTSWGVGCAEKTPSVFLRVAEIKHWIDGWFDVFKYNKDYEYESTRIVF